MVKYCKKCNKEYTDKHKYCSECGNSLIKKDFKSKKNHYDKSKNWFLVTIGVVFITIILFIFSVPMPYSATEEYAERVPFEDEETYTVSEPYSDTVCSEEFFDYRIREDDPQWSESIPYNEKSFFTQRIYLENLESETGCWLGYVALYENDVFKDRALSPSRICVEPKSTKISEAGWPSGSKERILKSNSLRLKYDIVFTPSKTVCDDVTNTKKVTKTRTVTRFSDETKNRTITKYATLFQTWTGQVR